MCSAIIHTLAYLHPNAGDQLHVLKIRLNIHTRYDQDEHVYYLVTTVYFCLFQIKAIFGIHYTMTDSYSALNLKE